jgi:hypothetical protein
METEISSKKKKKKVDPGRVWKGPWRWFQEDLLDCCKPLEDIRRDGTTIGEVACLARCNGATATVVRVRPADDNGDADNGNVDNGARAHDFDDADVRAFRAVLDEACRLRGPIGAGATPVAPVDPWARRSDEDGDDGDGDTDAHPLTPILASYDRGSLGQTGTGHFSPVVAFHPGADAVLILDTASFKYEPHWVRVADLVRAMRPIDPSTGLTRGYLILERARGRVLPVVATLLGRGMGPWNWRRTQVVKQALGVFAVAAARPAPPQQLGSSSDGDAAAAEDALLDATMTLVRPLLRSLVDVAACNCVVDRDRELRQVAADKPPAAASSGGGCFAGAAQQQLPSGKSCGGGTAGRQRCGSTDRATESVPRSVAKVSRAIVASLEGTVLYRAVCEVQRSAGVSCCSGSTAPDAPEDASPESTAAACIAMLALAGPQGGEGSLWHAIRSDALAASEPLRDEVDAVAAQWAALRGDESDEKIG